MRAIYEDDAIKLCCELTDLSEEVVAERFRELPEVMDEVLYEEWAELESDHLWHYFGLEDDDKLSDRAMGYKRMLWHGYLQGKKEGEWLETEKTDCGEPIYKCSICGHELIYTEAKRSQFCPGCGRRMKGEVNGRMDTVY